MIIADTSAIVALLDRKDEHHASILELYTSLRDRWVLPWAVLPEIDYLVLRNLGVDVQVRFAADLAHGRWSVEWCTPADLLRAHSLCERYRNLQLGLVDTVVIAIAERLRAEAIVTLDERHFAAVEIVGQPKLLPRDH